MLSVLDWLDLTGLMHMAEVHPPTQMLIARYYLLPQYHLNSAEIIITLGKETHMVHSTHGRFADGPDRVLFVLQAFGHLFRNLKINVYQNEPSTVEKLSKYINKYCSKAKQEIAIYAGNDRWNFTFNNATKVTKHWSMLRINANQTTHWSDSFPRMEELVILNALSLTVINHHFPHLTRFTLRTSVDISDLVDLRDFFRLNPQLRTIEIPLSRNNALLAYMNEMLPNLESLTIGKSNVPNYGGSGIVRFKNVRHFSWAVRAFSSGRGWDIQLPNRFATIVFDQLESFTLDTDIPAVVRNHNQFVRNNALKMVDISKCELRYEDLMGIVRELPVLKEFSIGWEIRGTLATVRQFLIDDTQLDIVNIRILNELDLNAEMILDNIPVTWRMNGEQFIDGQRVLSFKRIE